MNKVSEFCKKKIFKFDFWIVLPKILGRSLQGGVPHNGPIRFQISMGLLLIQLEDENIIQ